MTLKCPCSSQCSTHLTKESTTRHHNSFHCLTKSYQNRAFNGEYVQYATDCCKTSMCNNDTSYFPDLPPIPKFGKNKTVLVSKKVI